MPIQLNQSGGDESLSAGLNIRVTQTAKERLSVAARADGITLSGYCARVLMAHLDTAELPS